MSQNSDYKNIKELISAISTSIEEMEAGKLSANNLTELLEDSRNLHERIAILQYLSFKEEVSNELKQKTPKIKQEKAIQSNFQLNFGLAEKEEGEEDEKEIYPNQINLIDAIEEQGEVTTIPAKEADENKKSVNEKFAKSAEAPTLAQKLSSKPIGKIKDSIALNEKFLFMNDLFQGENSFYNESIDQLDSFNNLVEATKFFQDLKTKFEWTEEMESVTKFFALIERRFQ